MKRRLDLLHRRAAIRGRQQKPMEKTEEKNTTRLDDPAGVMAHAAKYLGGVALIVLGGYSGKDWQALRDRINPDVILGGNGVNQSIPNLDYWVCAENMTISHHMAQKGDKRAIEFMRMFNHPSGAKVRLVNHKSWNYLTDTRNCIKIDRKGFDRSGIPASFSFRAYGDGLLNGWVFERRDAIKVPTSVGTVATQLLHVAGILGVSEIHTIGIDLIQRGSDSHHWYRYPAYQPDKFRTPGMFVEYRGFQTQLIWIETAEFLSTLPPVLERDGIEWVDHSDGLLNDKIFHGV